MSDERFETGSLSPATSCAASSATHLPEAATKSQTVTLPYFVGEKESNRNLDGPPHSQPLSTLRVLVAHIG